jgi:tetratricopeptide (TPR) repeat protein
MNEKGFHAGPASQTPKLETRSALQAALAAHERGQLDDAEKVYRSILSNDPKHFDAVHLLGLIFLQRGEYEAAERQIDLAIRIDPAFAPAHRNRGIALSYLKRLNEALTCIDKAIILKPTYAEAFIARGNVLMLQRRFKDALASFDKAAALQPANVEAITNRGNALHDMGRLEEALASFDRAIALRSDYAAAFCRRGNTLRELKRREEALASCDRAIALQTHYAEAYNERGLVLRDFGRLEEALANFDSAIALAPNYPIAFNNRGLVLQDLRRLEEALASFDRAIALDPAWEPPFFNRGMCKLLQGDMARGWPDYEYSRRLKAFSSPRPRDDIPDWSGESLLGRAILVYSERGFGDVFQFSRYLPLLAERGAAVTFLVPERLLRILGSLPQPLRLATSIRPADPFDVQCPLVSLPYRMGTDLANIPSSTPYLSADRRRAESWLAKLGPDGFKIGICWQGGLNARLVGRSFSIRELYPLAQVPNVRLISLQKDLGIEQLAELPAGMTVETLGDDFDVGADAFVDTAAVMENLDLIVTCDTSIAHLAGALARPTWVALRSVPEWRWMLDRSDSPWYPTMRLFRQRTLDDWSDVFSQMTAALEKLAPTTAASRLPA